MTALQPAYRFRSVVELHVAVFLFGLAGLFGKLTDVAPAIIAFARTTIAAGALIIILQWSRPRLVTFARQDLALLIVAGVFLAAHWVTFFHSIQISSVAIGLIGFAVFPIFVTLIEPLAFDAQFRKIDILCAVGVAIGLAVVAPSYNLSDVATRGLLWAISSGLLFALLTLINRHVVQKNEFRVVAAIQYGVASLFLLPAVFVTSGAMPSRFDILLLLVLGLIFTALPHTLFIKALAGVKAAYASVVVGLEPVYGIVFAALLLHEYPTMRTAVGAAIVIVAVAIASTARRGHQL
ncbi:MAG: DMT family transporter [Woeseia sp.]|jgi:drug/metabolite transporter (DMT)-like permease|nr:DMT family transporter [Woeseia sp.]MBT6211664.1 DMT family transporter [Woeseia sp.]